MAINPIDILLVIVIALSLLNGYRRGFVHGVLDLAGWVVSLIVGLRYYQPVARWLGAHIDVWSEVWDQPIAFVLVAILAGIAVHVIGYWLLKRLPENVQENRINRLFGLLPGFVNGVITAAILSALL
ncbi:MAG TPA: CvpA family protein, partial [Pyrinomonadaceae bacterium]|nr:CvpA family protein [Pyrinomonadaceae bacterium]